MAGTNLLRENNTADWLLTGANLVRENNSAGWLADKPSEHGDFFFA